MEKQETTTTATFTHRGQQYRTTDTATTDILRDVLAGYEANGRTDASALIAVVTLGKMAGRIVEVAA